MPASLVWNCLLLSRPTGEMARESCLWKGRTPLGYELHVLPMVFNGNFHVHFYRGLEALVQCFRPEIMHIDEEPYNLATFQAMRSAQRHGAQALFFTWQNLLRRYPPPFQLL